jgi:SAM-dependent methyltransferase
MDLEKWLQENEQLVDWQYFAAPWDEMQRRYNPFRQDQLDNILFASGILHRDAPSVLDLGCGPGTIGRLIVSECPGARYFGSDGDPLMLCALYNLLPECRERSLKIDLRTTDWTTQFANQFDAVTSLTALHWLSRTNLQKLYRSVFAVLKPGGTFVVGDPYDPDDRTERERLRAYQDHKVSRQSGPSWSEFWDTFFSRYPIRDFHMRYHTQIGYQEPFEGNDDGYPLSFHAESLSQAGFDHCAVFWKCGTRAVYGAVKPKR